MLLVSLWKPFPKEAEPLQEKEVHTVTACKLCGADVKGKQKMKGKENKYSSLLSFALQNLCNID